MTPGDRVSIVLLLALGLLVLVVDVFESQLRALLQRRRRGIAPPARWPRQDPATWGRRDPALLPPAGDWCGCCGNVARPDSLWCARCEAHVGTEGQPHDRTWYAMHRGEDCPFSETWDDETERRRDEIARAAEDLSIDAIEETRLMPGAEMDVVPEGLGIPGSPAIQHAHPSRARPLELLPRGERELWREALKASL